MNGLNGLKEYSRQLENCLSSSQMSDGFENGITSEEWERELVDLLLQVQESKKKVILVGNGGSAAVVAHMQNDLMKGCEVRALVLTEASLFTALINDEGYEAAYQRQVELWGEPGDLLLAVSSSGESGNILHACAAAQRHGMSIVTFSAFNPMNTLRRLGDLNLYIPSSSYGLVELSHSILLHYLTDRIAGLLPSDVGKRAEVLL